MLQKVDSIPTRSPWTERWLTFKDRPAERHLVQYRDVIKAIMALLGNPAHADQIVWRPRRVFTDASRSNRIYTDMWTGKWWHAVQVPTFGSYYCKFDLSNYLSRVSFLRVPLWLQSLSPPTRRS